MAKKFIIAAHSARAYAQAAAACGYSVITLDAFADADTQAASTQTFKLTFNDFMLDAADFKRVFLSINLDEVEGFLYGSLFDNCPELLAWVAARVRLLGNVPEVIQAAKNFEFFKLLDELNIAHPEVYKGESLPSSSFPHTTLQVLQHSVNRSTTVVRKRESILTLKKRSKKMDSRLRGNDDVISDRANWLAKSLGGTGGTHIKPAIQAKKGDYFQRKIDGKPISMLFVADGKTAHLIGFNEQFVAPTIDMPYRFAGAVSWVVLPENVQQKFCHAAQQLSSALNLRGINSLDAILDGDELWILELNPRLSATFNLYPNLLPAHIQGCMGDLMTDLKHFERQANTSNAQLIIYADTFVNVPNDKKWPAWVVDIPPPNSVIAAGMPICTVLATADNAQAATQMVLERARSL